MYVTYGTFDGLAHASISLAGLIGFFVVVYRDMDPADFVKDNASVLSYFVWFTWNFCMLAVPYTTLVTIGWLFYGDFEVSITKQIVNQEKSLTSEKLD